MMEVTFIDAEKLRRMQMLHVQFLLFDIRTAGDFALGHLKLAFNIPASEFLEKIETQVLVKDTPIIVYGENSSDCVEIVKACELRGYINMVVLECGYKEFLTPT